MGEKCKVGISHIKSVAPQMYNALQIVCPFCEHICTQTDLLAGKCDNCDAKIHVTFSAQVDDELEGGM